MSQSTSTSSQEFVPYPSNKELQTRNEHIASIVQDINTIKTLYSDMNTLIQDQSPEIDNIDLKIEEAHNNTEDALTDLKKAENYQKSNPIAKILTIGSCTAIGTVIGGPLGLIVGLKAGCLITAATGAAVGATYGTYKKP